MIENERQLLDNDRRGMGVSFEARTSPNQATMIKNDLCLELNVNLGDRRLNERFKTLSLRMAEQPSASFPSLYDTPALEAKYRLINNPKVNDAALSQPHIEQTFARAQTLGESLALHDTSDFHFPLYDGDLLRECLPLVSKSTQGFDCHTSLLASNDMHGFVLGVARYHCFTSHTTVKDEETEAFWRQRGGLYDDEARRWIEAIDALEAMAKPRDLSLIHVFDREADQYELLSQLIESKYRFVGRNRVNRLLGNGEKLWDETIFDAQPSLLLSAHINARSDRKRGNSTRKAHPARSARVAEFGVWAEAVCIAKPASAPTAMTRAEWSAFPATLDLNIVYLRELHRDPGEDAVEWTLMTTEPITTQEDIQKVINIYRHRWRIEEFFKVIKTGCAYEKRQFATATGLLNELAMTLPIAWWLLQTREMAEHYEHTDASMILSDFEVKVLQNLTPKYPWPKKITVKDVYYAIALLGGHLKRNGKPGWLVIGRGMTRLLDALSTARLLLSLSDHDIQILRHLPDL
jgi:hypothetical protein